MATVEEMLAAQDAFAGGPVSLDAATGGRDWGGFLMDQLSLASSWAWNMKALEWQAGLDATRNNTGVDGQPAGRVVAAGGVPSWVVYAGLALVAYLVVKKIS